MARAKRSDRDRAEARRRYRATLTGPAETAEPAVAEESEGPEAAAPAAATRRPIGRPTGSQRPATPPAAGARMGVVAAARGAYRRVDIRSDLRKLPRLLVNRAVWIPLLIALAATILTIAIGPGNQVASFAFTVFVLPPAMATVFITGFFAPTAAWLLGGIVGVVCAVFYAGFVLAAASGIVPGQPPGEAQDAWGASIASGFLIALLYGIVLGAAAAWYKRFLSLSSPARPTQGSNRKPRQGGSRQGGRR